MLKNNEKKQRDVKVSVYTLGLCRTYSNDTIKNLPDSTKT